MYIYKCIIKRIVDGDTVDIDIDLGFDLWLKNQRVRVYDIDTPETRTRDKVEEFYGELSKARVEELLPVGSEQKLRTHITDDKFGRILGEFFIGETLKSVSDTLVEEYHAVKYFGQNKNDIEEAHMKNRILLGEPHDKNN